MTNINLLPVSAPECHPQGAFYKKKIRVQHTNPGIGLHSTRFCIASTGMTMQYLGQRAGLYCPCHRRLLEEGTAVPK